MSTDGAELPEVKISDARAHLGDLVRAAALQDETTIITQNGKPQAVLVSYDEYRQYLQQRDERLWNRLAPRLEEQTTSHADVLRELAE
jgi:prevent-host-death family protein